MRSLKKKYLIKTTPEKVWQALIDPGEIANWGAGPAVMDGKVGTKFSLWGGDIKGENKEIDKGKKLVQDWYGGDWPEPSVLTITLKPKGEVTQVDLVQSNIPDKEAPGIDSGWDDFYFGPMKNYLEKKS